MPDDLPRTPIRGATPAASDNPSATPVSRFHLRLPDISIENSAARSVPSRPQTISPGSHDMSSAQPSQADDARQRAVPPRDSKPEVRPPVSEKLSDKEQRYAAGQREVAGMIEALRGKRQRVFRRLWVASVLLTAASAVALGVELLQRSDLWSYLGGSNPNADQSVVGEPRLLDGIQAGTSDKSEAPRVWSNGLPGDISEIPPDIEQTRGVKPAIEQISHSVRTGVWLPGTITDAESDGPDSGDHHDDHQSRTP